MGVSYGLVRVGGVIDRALRRLADSSVQIHVVSWIAVGGEFVGTVATIAMGLLSFPAFSGETPNATAMLVAAAAAFLGWGAHRGGGWILQRRRRSIDVDRSADVCASIRSLHAVVRDGHDPVEMRKHLLTCITDAAAMACPDDDAELFACLLCPTDVALDLVAYSNFRGGRIPSASLDLNTVDGAACAYRERQMNYIADTARSADPSAFTRKAYRCILSFPLVEGATCVGVVAIDSTKPNHFDGHLEELDAQLRPFIEVLHLNLSLAARGAQKRRAKAER